MDQNRKDAIRQIVVELLRSGPALPESKAKELSVKLMAEGKEALAYLLLEIARHGKETSPSTPSGMIPPYQKASAQTGQKKRKKKAGGQ
ncbi:MAG: hypothetical protein AB1656_07175 [Candidatus Omnitrophota bacterium]